MGECDETVASQISFPEGGSLAAVEQQSDFPIV